jgi:hypothetical protein
MLSLLLLKKKKRKKTKKKDRQTAWGEVHFLGLGLPCWLSRGSQQLGKIKG